jgi:hypothetical protein
MASEQPPRETECRREPGPTPHQLDRHAGDAHGKLQPNPSIDDDELKRLEESIRLILHEGKFGRGRSDGIPSIPVVTPGEDHRPRRGETYVNARVPHSLQSGVLRRPRESGASRIRAAVPIVIAGAVAASIAFYFLSSSSDPQPPAGGSVIAAVEPVAAHDSDPWPKNVEMPQVPTPQVHTARAVAPQEPAPQELVSQAPASSEVSPQPAAAPVTVVPERAAQRAEGAETSQPRASAEQVPPAPPAVTRILGQAEIDLLVKQGQQFVAAGDFATARLLFQRAAEAGNAFAALALGASYDPVVLSSLGVRGVDADVNKARAWYEKAKELGEPEAINRLDVLARRSGR